MSVMSFDSYSRVIPSHMTSPHSCVKVYTCKGQHCCIPLLCAMCCRDALCMLHVCRFGPMSAGPGYRDLPAPYRRRWCGEAGFRRSTQDIPRPAQESAYCLPSDRCPPPNPPHSLTHSLTHLLTHSLTHSRTHSRTHSLTHARTVNLSHCRTPV